MSRKRPVVCYETGDKYESVSAAAKAIGRTHTGVLAAARTGCAANGLHFYYADEPRPDASFFKRPRPVVCYETGEVYESAREAAEATGVVGTHISASARKGTSAKGLHFYYADAPKPDESFFKSRAKRGLAVRCIETGEVFESISAAAAAVGVQKGRLSAVVNGKCGGYHWEKVDEENT